WHDSRPGIPQPRNAAERRLGPGDPQHLPERLPGNLLAVPGQHNGRLDLHRTRSVLLWDELRRATRVLDQVRLVAPQHDVLLPRDSHRAADANADAGRDQYAGDDRHARPDHDAGGYLDEHEHANRDEHADGNANSD